MTGNTVRLHRVLRAPADRVYRAFVHPDALASPVQDVSARDTAGAAIAAPAAPDHETSGRAGTVASGALHERAAAATPVPEAGAAAASELLPNAPLERLDPVAVFATATPREIAQASELRLQLIAARLGVAIADAWDSGRISKVDPDRPPFADEVAGLLRLASGGATAELAAAVARLQETEEMVMSAEVGRAGRLTPLDVIARDFGLSPVAVAVLFTIVAPHLRGELARLYEILSNTPGRSFTDEHLVGQILGPALTPEISRELDGDRPLRRFGLVRAGDGERPFVSLTVDPLVVRYIANQSPDGEPDLQLRVRHVDRDLEELQLPRGLIVHAMRFLASPREDKPVRVVVRGRTGSGRHTLLTSLAARAGRSLGVIDLAMVPREPGRLAHTLELLLRRAMLRGLIVGGRVKPRKSEPAGSPLALSKVTTQRPCYGRSSRL